MLAGETVGEQPYINPERLIRDGDLTSRIQAGYVPAEPTPEKPRPKIIDGSLSSDAQIALGELWEHYRPAAFGVANGFRSHVRNLTAIDVEDLVNEGYFGLYHASVRWTPQKGITFLTQARGLMHKYMARYIDNQESAVRLPKEVRADIRRVRTAAWRIYQHQAHFPNSEAIASALERSPQSVRRTRYLEALTTQMGSTDGGYFEDERDGPSIFGAGEARWNPIDPAAAEQRDIEIQFLLIVLVAAVRKAVSGNSGNLSARELEVVRQRFLDDHPMTQRVIAREQGVSHQRIRQIESKALAKLRHPKVYQALKDYLINT